MPDTDHDFEADLQRKHRAGGMVLDALEISARDFGKPHVYGLNGVARTGKTTISRMIAAIIFAD